MISTPNLEGGTITGNYVSKFYMVTLQIGASETGYVHLEFIPRHLWFYPAINAERCRPSGSIKPTSLDLVYAGTHVLSTYNGNTVATMTYDSDDPYNINYSGQSNQTLIFYMAVPS